MSSISLLIGKKPKINGMKTIETTEGTYEIVQKESSHYDSFQISWLNKKSDLTENLRRKLMAGINVLLKIENGLSYWSLETYSPTIRSKIENVISLAFYDNESLLRSFEVPQTNFAHLYQRAKQVLECRVKYDNDEILFEDINLRELRQFSEFSKIGNVIEILATLEPSDGKGIYLVRILKDGRFVISPEIDHSDAFEQILNWLDVT